MNETRFNKLFNAFVLGGMVVCVILASVIKFRTGQSSGALLMIAAAGALAGVISTVLSANGSIWNFLFGLIDVLFYSYILYINGQPAQLALHLLYILPMEFVGFFRWRKIGLKKDTVKARHLPAKRWPLVIALFTAVFAASLALSYFLSDSGSVIAVKLVLDALITTANIVAFVLMAGAYMEQWYLWIIVNIGSIALWGLTPVLTPGADYAIVPLIKYIFYMINSVNGVRIWLKLSRS